MVNRPTGDAVNPVPRATNSCMKAATSSNGGTLRQLLCALGVQHRYRYVGILFGQRLELCDRCGEMRIRRPGVKRKSA